MYQFPQEELSIPAIFKIAVDLNGATEEDVLAKLRDDILQNQEEINMCYARYNALRLLPLATAALDLCHESNEDLAQFRAYAGDLFIANERALAYEALMPFAHEWVEWHEVDWSKPFPQSILRGFYEREKRRAACGGVA